MKDLVEFGKYKLSYVTGDIHSNYIGEGILIKINPKGYPDGTLKFYLPSMECTGHFSRDDIVGTIVGTTFMPYFNETSIKNIISLCKSGAITEDHCVKSIMESHELDKWIN